MELLIDEVAAGPGHEHRHVVFTPELVVRSSTLVPGRERLRLSGSETFGPAPLMAGQDRGREAQDAAETVVGRSARSASICSRDLPVVSGIAK